MFLKQNSHFRLKLIMQKLISFTKNNHNILCIIPR